MTDASIVEQPDGNDITEAKKLADGHRWELGFHARQAYEDSAARREMLVARIDGQMAGFVRYHHRRDRGTTIYEFATAPAFRRSGVAQKLLATLKTECQRIGYRRIQLLCPADLEANAFYAAMGFQQRQMRSDAGKNRPLFRWELTLLPKRPLVFVASLTACTADLAQMIPLWEKHGQGRPFGRCIVTPLFMNSKAFEHVRYLRERWGVEVMFDSGGFFVQQEKIRYDDLFVRLLDFYSRHLWADVYVLPDYVPTSRHSPAEVEERVHVTQAEGLRFLDRLPAELRGRALGALQGHSPEHLRGCFEAFANKGLRQFGFGSFDTRGVNAEINILTRNSATRLAVVRRLIDDHFDAQGTAPELHLFGVGSPAVIRSFRGYRATSFDSSGWLRTAGFGNVYLPFRTRRNVSHGAAGISVGHGLRAAEFYAECERTRHACPFCANFARLQGDRFFRMWHNAIVFAEMTRRLDDLA